jgi:hypothetical protein
MGEKRNRFFFFCHELIVFLEKKGARNHDTIQSPTSYIHLLPSTCITPLNLKSQLMQKSPFLKKGK